MTRPLRVNLEGGWSHVYSRGLNRMRLFNDDRDREYMLERLEAMLDRYRVEVPAYAWMETHDHLVLRTPDANLSDAIAVGGAVFVRQIRELAPEFGFGRETAFQRATRARVSLPEIIRAIEVIRGEEWESLCSRHGDPALALAMWLARRCTGLSLRAIGQALGGRDYAAVGMAVRRLGKRAQTDKTLKQQMRAACQMLEVKMSP